MSASGPPVAVLGAGIQGACLALALAKRGIAVDLYDMNAQPLQGASMHGEGKLHLGFVYANDPFRSTYRMMIDGSLAFAPIIKRLTGVDLATLPQSSPFEYAVATDSLIEPDAVEAHFAAVASVIREREGASDRSYLGRPIRQVYERCRSDETVGRFDPHAIQTVFRTAERAIATPALATALCRVIANETSIHFHPRSKVLAADIDTARGVTLRIDRAGTISEPFYPVAVNCLWDGRLKIDASAGIRPQRPWLFRYKATLRVKSQAALAQRLPSTTLILGAYGDLVNFGDGDFYVSWYPKFKLGQTDGLDGGALHSLLDGVDRQALGREGIAAMATYVPGVGSLLDRPAAFEVGGGVIFAWGSTDVDDRCSELHQRFAIGVQRHGPYLSIDTGKYCTAPMFAVQAADAVGELLG